MLEYTGERFLPWIEETRLQYEHLHRYAFASHFVKGKKVLDLACGEGYGTYMLAREAEHVTGVEIDKPTVQHARGRYIKDNLEFIQGSILAVPIEGEKKFDVAVCFEGIEHVEEHDKLLSEVKRLLKDDGLFIVSTPNKKVLTDELGLTSSFHVKELYHSQFEQLLGTYFRNVHLLGQKVYSGSNLWNISSDKHSSHREFVTDKRDKEFYFTGTNKKRPWYIVGLASDANFEPQVVNVNSWLVDVSDSLVKDYERQTSELNSTLRARDSRIISLEASRREKASQINGLESQIHSLESQLHQIQQSIPMQLVNRYQKVTEKLLRSGTRRRRFYELGLSGIRVILNEGWKSFFREVAAHLRRKGRASK